MRISPIIQVIALFVATLAVRAENVPGSVERILKKVFSSEETRSMAMGDLDGDGIKDVAAVVASSTSGEDAQRIVVLKGAPQGQFQVWSQSNKFIEFRKGGPDLEIKRGSLFVYSMDATCCESGYRHLQFRYNGQHFRLIGVRSGESSTTGDDNFEHEVSFNIATGDKVEKKRVGKRRKQIQVKLPTKEPQVLDGFDMNLAPWIEEAVQFSIDDKFGVKPAP